ncbi:MAG: EF-P lysine aminoacylase GenX [Planctomycetales bacterium]|nr:EF-P lysine aminoacylase GenX [Planctomycetales bacterium]
MPTAERPALELRARLLQTVRRFFADRGFLEVETPLLSADTVVDRHIDPLCAHAPDHPSLVGWLQTSPEFCMKRLLATGQYEAIFQITRAFRAGEQGPRHNCEFTIVEWYRVGDDAAAGMRLLSDLADAALARGEARVVSYRQAFEKHANCDPHRDSAQRLAAVCAERGLHPPAGLDRDGLLDFMLVELVAPQLGRTAPEILCDYPASQAALAQVCVDVAGDRVAERFELFVDGMELANGYHELLDPTELARRSAEGNVLRREDGKSELPADSRLLAAMRHGLPACSGTALGFDRLAMIALGAASIDEVWAFPFGRA